MKETRKHIIEARLRRAAANRLRNERLASKELWDRYIRQRLKGKRYPNIAEIPQRLVNLKRKQLQLHREIMGYLRTRKK